MNNVKVFVSSRSFSSNNYLKKILLSKYPNTIFNNTGRKLTQNEFISFARDADKVIVALDRIDKKVLKQLPNLKLISKYGVGLDNINLQDLEKYNIKLGWSQGQNARSVAELTIGYMFSISRNLFKYQYLMKDKFIFNQIISNQVSNKKIGIIGFGSIGSELAKLLSPFRCKIFFNDIRKIKPKSSLQLQKSLNFILKNCDIISIHVPLTSRSKNLINSKNIYLCKKNTLIINCARGGIIDENAIYSFLKKNKFSNAAFDVFIDEPPKKNKLLNLENFYCSPHIGGSTNQSIINMGLSAIRGLDKTIDYKKLYKFGYE